LVGYGEEREYASHRSRPPYCVTGFLIRPNPIARQLNFKPSPHGSHLVIIDGCNTVVVQRETCRAPSISTGGFLQPLTATNRMPHKTSGLKFENPENKFHAQRRLTHRQPSCAAPPPSGPGATQGPVGGFFLFLHPRRSTVQITCGGRDTVLRFSADLVRLLLPLANL